MAEFNCHFCGEELESLTIEISANRTVYEYGSYELYIDLDDNVEAVPPSGKQELELEDAGTFASHQDLLYDIENWESNDSESEIEDAYWVCPCCNQRSRQAVWDGHQGLVEVTAEDDTDQLLRELEAIKAKLVARGG